MPSSATPPRARCPACGMADAVLERAGHRFLPAARCDGRAKTAFQARDPGTALSRVSLRAARQLFPIGLPIGVHFRVDDTAHRNADNGIAAATAPIPRHGSTRTACCRPGRENRRRNRPGGSARAARALGQRQRMAALHQPPARRLQCEHLPVAGRRRRPAKARPISSSGRGASGAAHPAQPRASSRNVSCSPSPCSSGA
jgi:hypothetical protein